MPIRDPFYGSRMDISPPVRSYEAILHFTWQKAVRDREGVRGRERKEVRVIQVA